MSIGLNISVTGIDQAIASITEVAQRIDNHSDFLRNEVEPELKNVFRDIFRSQGNRRWPQLKRSTIQQKTKKGYPSTPLVRTGNYRRQTESLNGLRITKEYLEVISPVPYARYLEYGTRHMEKREVFATAARTMRRRLPRMYEAYHQRRTR